MGSYPDLIHLDIGTLIAGAGGDPWRVDDTLQAGAPAEIAHLAETFRSAGGCVGEADLAFVEAKKRFEVSWNREDGRHPINDGAELQALTRSITFQKAQLPRIAADLETVAATLAEAQRFSRGDLDVLNGQLHVLDAMIDAALADRQGTTGLHNDAVAITADTLESIKGLRAEYSETLSQSLTTLRSDGSDPSHLAAVNGDRAPTDQPSNLSDALDQVAGAHVPEAADSAGEPGGPPANLSGALDEIAGAPVPATVTPPAISAEDIKAFKVAARPVLAGQGVPPEQIESRLAQIVARAQRQPLNPFYRPPEPGRMPAPGFGEGFGDAWRNAEQSLKNLVGQGGPGATGVLDSWKGVAKGINDAMTNPVGVAVGQVQHALDSPSAAYYAGEKAFDFAAAAATAPFGGEGAAVRAGLPAELVTEGGAPLAVMRGWDPLGGLPANEFQNLFGTPQARIWPDNDGFPPGYVPQPAHLPEGTIIDRFGSEFGQYLSPDGTPFGDRSVRPETTGGQYNRYMITGAPLPPGWQIVEGPVHPWFGQTPTPGAVQYMVVGPEGVTPTVKDLLEEGIIDRAGPPLGR